jgi:polyol permease family
MNSSAPSRIVFGMPVLLFWGYLAVGIFMTGDGIEVAFLSRYMVDIGFSGEQAALLFTVYGATAAVASWLSGVLGEVYGPHRVMSLGAVWWVVCQVLFLHFGLAAHDYGLMLFLYGLRGFAYPLFFYAFFVLVVQKTPHHRLASAVGWIWAMFMIGFGTVATFLPKLTIPRIGYMGTLWLSVLWAAIGGVIAMTSLRKVSAPSLGEDGRPLPLGDKLREISRGLTLIFENRDIFLALVIRVICNLALYGVPVIMPLYYTSQRIGFSMDDWLLIYLVMNLVQPVTNVLWGIVGDRIGWLRQMRWAGFVGCGIANLLLFYLPLNFPAALGMAMLAALCFAFSVTAFVPMGAIFPMIAPEHKGAAVSVQNLGGGLSNLMGPAIATLVLRYYGSDGPIVDSTRSIMLIYAGFYFIAAVLTCFIRLQQPRGVRAKELLSH